MFHFYVSTYWLSMLSKAETYDFYVSLLVSIFHTKNTEGEKQKHCGSDSKPLWERFKNTVGAWKRSISVLASESTYKKCLREEWGKFTGYQSLSSFWLKVARTDEDGNTTRWDRGTLPIRNLYPQWWMLRFGRMRKVTNRILRLWFIVSY